MKRARQFFFILMCFSHGFANAEIVTSRFEGEILSPGFSSLLPLTSLIELFSAGTLISGTFSYDTAVQGSDVSVSVGDIYKYDALTDFRLNIGQYTFPLDLSLGSGFIEITNDRQFLSGFYDEFVMAGYYLDLNALYPDSQTAGTSALFSLKLRDLDGSAFADATLPNPLSLNDFPHRKDPRSSGYPQKASLAIVINGMLSGRVDILLTEISPVPVPAAAWLFGSGLVTLLGIRRFV